LRTSMNDAPQWRWIVGINPTMTPLLWEMLI
jgi:hypothetical protein